MRINDVYDFVEKVVSETGKKIVAARARSFTPGGFCG
jgi:hypothetical protein